MEHINGIARDLLPYPEHRATLVAFFDIVNPEICPDMARRLNSALKDGDLTDLGARFAFRTLWADDLMKQARIAWRASEPPLA